MSRKDELLMGYEQDLAKLRYNGASKESSVQRSKKELRKIKMVLGRNKKGADGNNESRIECYLVMK